MSDSLVACWGYDVSRMEAGEGNHPGCTSAARKLGDTPAGTGGNPLHGRGICPLHFFIKRNCSVRLEAAGTYNEVLSVHDSDDHSYSPENRVSIWCSISAFRFSSDVYHGPFGRIADNVAQNPRSLSSFGGHSCPPPELWNLPSGGDRSLFALRSRFREGN